MPTVDLSKPQQAMGLLTRTSSREGKRLDGVGLLHCVLLANIDEKGAVSMGSWVGIMLGVVAQRGVSTVTKEQ